MPFHNATKAFLSADAQHRRPAPLAALVYHHIKARLSRAGHETPTPPHYPFPPIMPVLLLTVVTTYAISFGSISLTSDHRFAPVSSPIDALCY